MDTLENDVKRLIIEALALEDLSPEDIDTEAPLFNEGLGLDSIDALELGMALRKQYGIQFESANAETRAHFRSVATLAALVRAQLAARAAATKETP